MAPKITAVEFDFALRSERSVDLAQALSAKTQSKFVWLDVEFDETESGRDALRDLHLLREESIDDAVMNEPLTRHARFPEYLHLVVSGCRLQDSGFELERVDIFMGEHFLVTAHRGEAGFLTAVKNEYAEDFQRFAQSPSFLIYELWDRLLDNYLEVQKQMEERVEETQQRLIGSIDDGVFTMVSDLGADLLHFRKVVLPARAVLMELATRKSIFISDATQPYLTNMVGTVEHVLQDLLVARDILSESLNLHMSMVGHRTNEVMKRLTIVSIVFLPLSFLCGVYGMNFQVIPELGWKFGYLYFWSLVVSVALGLVWLLHRTRML